MRLNWAASHCWVDFVALRRAAGTVTNHGAPRTAFLRCAGVFIMASIERSAPSLHSHSKNCFFATAHFGSGVAALGLGTNTQLDELSGGSHFLVGLATSNDNTDDLRSVDAATLMGNGGTGRATTQVSTMVALTAASLGFLSSGPNADRSDVPR